MVYIRGLVLVKKYDLEITIKIEFYSIIAGLYLIIALFCSNISFTNNIF